MEITKLERRVLDLPGQVKNLPKIANQLILDRYNAARSHILELKKEVDGTFDPIIKKANDAHKEAIAQKKRYAVPLKEADDFVKSEIGAYVAEQERIRREAIREAEEKRRLEQEKLKLEAEEKLRAALETSTENVDEAVQEAAEIENQISELEKTRPLNDAPVAPVLKNAHTRDVWDFSIHSPDLIPRKYLIPDEALIRRVVKAERDRCDIPGIRVFSKKIVVGR